VGLVVSGVFDVKVFGQMGLWRKADRHYRVGKKEAQWVRGC
jgi:hypothetical protein